MHIYSGIPNKAFYLAHFATSSREWSARTGERQNCRLAHWRRVGPRRGMEIYSGIPNKAF
ncbi:hypothetical protein IMZ48_03245 [Candidatus Bathyarchaeota archaeon]|nr:hypothetical protein [Candidatus Bathyarchaeota archaeon]